MSPCTIPRLGTEPRLVEKDKVSVVRFSSRMLSLLGTGTGNGVGVAVLCGRKIVLNPLPVNVPVQSASGPRLGAREPAARNAVRLDTAPNRKPLGRKTAGSSCVSLIAASSNQRVFVCAAFRKLAALIFNA